MQSIDNYKILITGANGQLGMSIQEAQHTFSNFHFIFTDIEELDITDENQVFTFFEKYKPDFCINTAAYTAVDKAESDQELCTLINQTGPKNLAIACQKLDCTLIHISTDYVYDCCDNEILTEISPVSPKSWYAISKLAGEREIINTFQNYIIIRTSWLYSEFGHNFVKTILRLAKERKELTIVNDQIGSPTYAGDLALAILQIIDKKSEYGVFNYSNEGFISWYDFAREIIFLSGADCNVLPINSDQYPTPAPRPKNSRLSKDKFRQTFKISIPDWKVSLEKCLQKL